MITDNCPNCGRLCELTKHHLIPKNKKGKNREENYFYLCTDCHTQLHLLYCNSILRDVLNTKENILADEQMIKFRKFARKQQGKIKRRQSNDKWN